ncbi:hypothetical protein ABFA07_009672 [Porites harrisoni]
MAVTRTLLVLLFAFVLIVHSLKRDSASDSTSLLNELLKSSFADADVQQEDFYGIPGCKNKFSFKFCRRMRKYCGHGDKNGRYMRSKCRFSCGCV